MARTNVGRVAHFNHTAEDLSTAVGSFLSCRRSRNLSECTIGY